jgi:hypothetical protein
MQSPVQSMTYFFGSVGSQVLCFSRLMLASSLGLVVLGVGGERAIAFTFILTNGDNDGQVNVEVDGYGAFGRALPSSTTGTLEAFYNPVGPGAIAGTVFESEVAFRLNSVGERVFLAEDLINPPAGSSPVPSLIGQATNTQVQTAFKFGNLNFGLTQSLSSLFSGTTQTGSRLTQTYSISNSTTAALSFDLLRYLDGDLQFNQDFVADGGGIVTSQATGQVVLFETDTAIGALQSDTFVGITSSGGTASGYEVGKFPTRRFEIISGLPLTNTVFQDTNGDSFVDANKGYDVILALSNSFTLAPGASTTYTTETLFGTGSPQQTVVDLPPTPVVTPTPIPTTPTPTVSPTPTPIPTTPTPTPTVSPTPTPTPTTTPTPTPTITPTVTPTIQPQPTTVPESGLGIVGSLSIMAGLWFRKRSQ